MKKIEMVDILKGAKNILEQNDWTRYSFARDKYGKKCHPTDPSANQYCVIGAIIRSINRDPEEKFSELTEDCITSLDIIPELEIDMKNMAGEKCPSTLTVYNDVIATKDEILELMSKTINRLSSNKENNDGSN